jgi:hypothetical protein
MVGSYKMIGTKTPPSIACGCSTQSLWSPAMLAAAIMRQLGLEVVRTVEAV